MDVCVCGRGRSLACERSWFASVRPLGRPCSPNGPLPPAVCCVIPLPRRGALKVVHSSRQRIHPLPFLTFSLQTPTSLPPLSTLRTLLRSSCPSWSISKLSSSSRLPTKSQERKLAYSRVIACPTAPDPWMQPIEHDIQPASLSPTLE